MVSSMDWILITNIDFSDYLSLICFILQIEEWCGDFK